MKKDNNKYPSFLCNEQDEDLNTRPANTNTQTVKKPAKQTSEAVKRTNTTDRLLYLAGNAFSVRQVNRKSQG